MRIGLAMLSLLLLLEAKPCLSQVQRQDTRVSISGAWAIYPLAVRWTEEFQKTRPETEFDVSAGGAGKGMTDVLAGAVDIGMVSRDVSQEETQKGAVIFAVAKDAVVPVTSAKNPVLPILRKQGISRRVFQSIWRMGSVDSWEKVVNVSQHIPLHVYTRSDACGAAETWAKYLDKKQEDLKGIGVYGDPGIGEAVRKDAVGLGYNNINFAYDAKTGKPVNGLAIVPIDLNGNNLIDQDESFYEDRTALLRAIAADRYPSPPARDLYFVTKGAPEKGLRRDFIRWVLTEGQKFVAEAGYIVLPHEILTAQLKTLGK